MIRNRVLQSFLSITQKEARLEFSSQANSKSNLNNPEIILSNENRQSCISRLKLIKASKDIEKGTSEAAVLVPICISEEKLGLLYTLRSTKVSMNRGQVSFPGGMKDPSDISHEETAVREFCEELNLPKSIVDVWGSGNVLNRKHVNILPVVGFIGKVHLNQLRVNEQEVEEAFFHSFESLCNPALCRYTQFKDSYTLPVYFGTKYKIWGLTAAITHIVMCALLPNYYKHKLPHLKSVQTS